MTKEFSPSMTDGVKNSFLGKAKSEQAMKQLGLDIESVIIGLKRQPVAKQFGIMSVNQSIQNMVQSQLVED